MRILNGERNESDLLDIYEKCISELPTVFQIETTNVCNMRCEMCPRTTLMKRKIGTMSMDLYEKIIDQIEPPSPTTLLKWRRYIDLVLSKTDYIRSDEDFFNFVISTEALTLHGFGEPILDPHIVKRVKLATDKGLKTYFSCNPLNMDDALFERLLDAGIGYIKYSLDGINEETLQKFRGKKMSIEEIYNRINKSVETIKQGGYKTVLVLTMIKFKSNQDQTEKFLKEWNDKEVFAYVKSSHNSWYSDEVPAQKQSHYMRSFCEYPFMSMTILYDGTVVPCSLDFDGALPLGDSKKNSLKEIWDGEPFRNFREALARGNIPPNHFCNAQCDLPILGDVYRNINRKCKIDHEIVI